MEIHLKTIEEFMTELPDKDRETLIGAFDIRNWPAGSYLSSQGEREESEYFLLSGRARSVVTDAEGAEVNLNLYAAPMVITPNMARTSGGRSLVDIEIVDDAVVGVSAPVGAVAKREDNGIKSLQQEVCPVCSQLGGGADLV